MTTRRALGTGPEDPSPISAAQADLLPGLPGIRLPNLEELRARGVLGAPPPAAQQGRPVTDDAWATESPF